MLIHLCGYTEPAQILLSLPRPPWQMLLVYVQSFMGLPYSVHFVSWTALGSRHGGKCLIAVSMWGSSSRNTKWLLLNLMDRKPHNPQESWGEKKTRVFRKNSWKQDKTWSRMYCFWQDTEFEQHSFPLSCRTKKKKKSSNAAQNNGYSKYQFLMELLEDRRNLCLPAWLVPFKYH